MSVTYTDKVQYGMVWNVSFFFQCSKHLDEKGTFSSHKCKVRTRNTLTGSIKNDSTNRKGVIFQKLVQLFRNSPPLTEPKYALLLSKLPATLHYSETD
jgi:hypothetical protein